MKARGNFIMAAMLVLGWANQGWAIVVTESTAEYQASSNQFLFRAVFDRVPDMETMDQYDRRADCVAWDIDLHGLFRFTRVDTDRVIRVEQVTGEIGEVTLYDTVNWGNPDPDIPWWVPIRSVPFLLIGNAMEFSFEVPDLGLVNQTFSYQVFTTEYGRTVWHSNYVSSPIPCPATAILLGVGGILIRALRRSGR